MMSSAGAATSWPTATGSKAVSSTIEVSGTYDGGLKKFYGKGALGFDAVRQVIGDDAFFAALRDYATRFRFGVATPDDLRAAFERASGQDLRVLWRHWFDTEEGTRDFTRADYADLVRRLRNLRG